MGVDFKEVNCEVAENVVQGRLFDNDDILVLVSFITAEL
jgi:hypothetical protein